MGVYIGPLLSKTNKVASTLTRKTNLSKLNKTTPKLER